MKKFNFLVLLGLVSLQISSAHASDVKVEWTEPNDFRDIRTTNAGQKRFQNRVLTELSEQFQESARQYLPDNQTLYLTITDVDLAGRIDYGFSPELRVIRTIDFPQINFNYEIKDENGLVVSSGEEIIKDLGFESSVLRFRYRDSFPYEKKLIARWFKNTF